MKIASDKEIINNTNYFTLCKNCGHTRDWHHKGGIFSSQIFGVELGECTHYSKDETLPFWKRKKRKCNCNTFSPIKGEK